MDLEGGAFPDQVETQAGSGPGAGEQHGGAVCTTDISSDRRGIILIKIYSEQDSRLY